MVMPNSALFEQGMKTRRAILGDKHVDAATARISDLDRDFQTFITETAWGTVWSNPDLTPRERSLITLAILAALGREEEFAMHVRATANTGATQEDLAQVLMHVAIYSGVPSANAAFRLAKEELKKVQGEDR
ncbi:4-carboxymuconolactone decarboxylase [Devosia sp. WQ 349]|uniref:4-carboxymuconolactone decarboxylase n=1 Tax=Devosia sp. WQ 349K1 TaxID=2800329 RepID=UPI001906484C|nr:4-carboxymuconolactone decarboxylase [Devosia sp. WQ 349K1]MBK1795892.1 4-carboxymuconolactone decarboxylase [Devosia sp. WQ 349K1]